MSTRLCDAHAQVKLQKCLIKCKTKQRGERGGGGGGGGRGREEGETTHGKVVYAVRKGRGEGGGCSSSQQYEAPRSDPSVHHSRVYKTTTLVLVHNIRRNGDVTVVHSTFIVRFGYHRNLKGVRRLCACKCNMSTVCVRDTG